MFKFQNNGHNPEAWKLGLTWLCFTEPILFKTFNHLRIVASKTNRILRADERYYENPSIVLRSSHHELPQSNNQSPINLLKGTSTAIHTIYCFKL